jgi:hypothetical protein
VIAFEFQMIPLDVYPALTLYSNSFVVSENPIPLTLHFSSSVSDLHLNLSSIILVHATSSSLITSVNNTYIWYIIPTDNQTFINVQVPDNIVFDAQGRGNTGNVWNMIYGELSHTSHRTSEMMKECRYGEWKWNAIVFIHISSYIALFNESIIIFLIYSSSHFLHYFSSAPAPISVGVWHPLYELRDVGSRWPVNRPTGGWYVTTINSNVLGDGDILITGWGRSEEFACTSAGSRRQGVTYRVRPNVIMSNNTSPNTTLTNFTNTYYITSIDEAPRNNSDVLYCAGQTTLRDGRKFYAGGAWYKNLSSAYEKEYGIPYIR